MYLFTRKRKKFPWRKYYNLRSYYSKKGEWLAKRRQPSAVGIWRNRIEYYFSLENDYILRSLITLLFFFNIKKIILFLDILNLHQKFRAREKKGGRFSSNFFILSFYTHNRFIIISRYLSQFRENRRENRRKGRNNRAIRGGQFRSKSRPRVKFERGRGG